MPGLNELVVSYEKDMIDTMSKMIAIKAISPANGGEGESKRADFLQSLLESWGFKVDRYEYKDDNGIIRPNLVTKYGTGKRTLWSIAHIDTVSEGDIGLWKTDPFKATIKDGRIYGRGTMDDGQPLVSSMYALKALKESKQKLKYNFGLALVADEELGSKYGIQKVLNENIFGKEDMFFVPDWWTPDGKSIEVAEKSALWLKMTFKGKQVHASTPDDGVNAYRYSIRFLNTVDELLHKKYSNSNEVFNPPKSTFEMTKHEKNVDSTNIIPGSEISYLDCRILPEYKISEVMNDIQSVAKSPAFKPVQIALEPVQEEEAAPPTKDNAEIVQLLKKVIKDQRGIDVKAVGIGGGTCAAFFRRKGFDSIVWATGDNTEHQPNEYLIIKNMVDDAKVFANLFV
ncbi:MAG: M20 family metallo-hydrolase [Candidatus Marsarchaeota archaeon]|nr:M20 family metallo-hydrolase [Candidatus Marsarchaeota archaeon]